MKVKIISNENDHIFEKKMNEFLATDVDVSHIIYRTASMGEGYIMHSGMVMYEEAPKMEDQYEIPSSIY